MIDTITAVDDNPTLVVPAGGTAGVPVRVFLSVASGGDTIYIGGPAVDGTTHGYPLVGGASMYMELIGEALYAITETSENLNVLALGV